MRNPILNQKMRMVDLGVAVCVDAIIHHAEALQAETLTEAEQAQHKAKIRENAHTYKQAIDELLSVLDTESQPAAGVKNRENLTACNIPHSAALEQCEYLATLIENETALVKIYENYTSCLRSFNPKELLNDIHALSHVHHVYLDHIGTAIDRLQSILQGSEQC